MHYYPQLKQGYCNTKGCKLTGTCGDAEIYDCL